MIALNGRGPLFEPRPDTGCGGACTRSTECPFPVCRYDLPANTTQQRLAAVNAQRVREGLASGLSIAEAARWAGVSKRTVQRVMAQRRAGQ